MSGAIDHRVEQSLVNKTQVKITSYQIGDRYYCQVANVDPGATIARAVGSSAEEAREIAIRKAESRL